MKYVQTCFAWMTTFSLIIAPLGLEGCSSRAKKQRRLLSKTLTQQRQRKVAKCKMWLLTINKQLNRVRSSRPISLNPSTCRT